jgi:hypothetical protein
VNFPATPLFFSPMLQILGIVHQRFHQERSARTLAWMDISAASQIV